MNAKLSLIAKQVERQQAKAPAPVETSGVGGAIENLIADEVERRVAQALAAQKQMLADQQPKPRFDDFRQIPPTPKAVTPKPMQGVVQRDGSGLPRAMVINGQRFLLQRDAAGQLVGFVDEKQASEVRYDGQSVPPAVLNRPRGPYGNDPEV
ncbi:MULTISPECIES: hypothetical protein [unclassified Pseudomonas]|uniref:hypothetical protein n=1 Tax=unclassified Pseudomonas TaxID=196821 RepID=UPI003FA1A374